LKGRAVRQADSLAAIRAENELLELKLERQKQENRLRQTIIYGLVAILAIISIATFLILRSNNARRKANRLLALQHLRAQMNPHFIFNSLNSINNFIARNDERSANKYLSEFSKLMRAVLENSKHPFVSLQSELDILKLYLDLEHLRFTDKFDYQFNYDPELKSEEILIPPMLVQPYIENSIWHGLRYKEKKGLLKVNFTKNTDHILCTVEDDGIGRKKSAELKTRNQQQGESTAIKNIEHRLKIINEIHGLNLKVRIIDIENGDETGTRVEVMMPYITNNEIF
jgi:LytS/YehU family sensor histidine kinase